LQVEWISYFDYTMKKMFFLSVASALALGVTVTYAQPEQRPQGGERPTAQQMAEDKSNQLATGLGLTDKQRQKVYKIYLRQAQKMNAQSSGSSRPDFGGMPGGGPQGGGMPGGGGHMGGGMRGGMGGGPQGGGPGQQFGGPQQMGGGEQPPMGVNGAERHPVPVIESDKEIQARDKKMRKILNDEQYAKWSQWENQERSRAVHRAWSANE
jgi:hypothetical protein